MKIEKAFIFIALFLSVSVIYAENWILAISEFEGDNTLSKIVPMMFLNAIPENLTRTVSLEEQRHRKQLEIDKARSKLLSEMQTVIKNRDAILFDGTKEWQKNISKKESEEKISNLKKEISDNLQARKLNEFKAENIQEAVILWKKDNLQLCNYTNKEAVGNINGFIHGSIQKQDDFIFIKASLTVFPGEINSGEFYSSGSISETDFIVNDLVQQMLSSFVNSQPSSINLKVLPQEAANNATIRVDENVFRKEVSLYKIQNGIHQVTVEAPGYRQKSFTYNFTGNTFYRISVELESVTSINLSLSIPESTGTNNIYLSGTNISNHPDGVTVNGLPVLGEVVGDNNVSSLFIVSSKKDEVVKSNGFYIANVSTKQETSTDIIEKSRKNMYSTYGWLLLSLPVTFFSIGQYQNIKYAYNNDYTNESDKILWEVVSNVSIGASIGLGVNWIWNLVKYVIAANTVLPEEISVEEKIDE